MCFHTVILEKPGVNTNTMPFFLSNFYFNYVEYLDLFQGLGTLEGCIVNAGKVIVNHAKLSKVRVSSFFLRLDQIFKFDFSKNSIF